MVEVAIGSQRQLTDTSGAIIGSVKFRNSTIICVRWRKDAGTAGKMLELAVKCGKLSPKSSDEDLSAR
jgi:hypothetical protein